MSDAKDSTADAHALGGAKTKAALDALLSQLPKCISRELCDELSVNFCYLNSKAARKRLVGAHTSCCWLTSICWLLQYYCTVSVDDCSISSP